jgi:hypothetical protein
MHANSDVLTETTLLVMTFSQGEASITFWDNGMNTDAAFDRFMASVDDAFDLVHSHGKRVASYLLASRGMDQPP